MKSVYILLFIILLSVLTMTGCSDSSKSKTSSSFVTDQMIIVNSQVYVGTSQKVSKVGKKIGIIKHYTTEKADFNLNYSSNYYHKGTKLFAIPHIPIKKAIAVRSGLFGYIKAVNIEIWLDKTQ